MFIHPRYSGAYIKQHRQMKKKETARRLNREADIVSKTPLLNLSLLFLFDGPQRTVGSGRGGGCTMP